MSEFKKQLEELEKLYDDVNFKLDTIFQYVEETEMMSDELSEKSDYHRGYHDAFASMYNLISAMLCGRDV